MARGAPRTGPAASYFRRVLAPKPDAARALTLRPPRAIFVPPAPTYDARPIAPPVVRGVDRPATPAPPPLVDPATQFEPLDVRASPVDRPEPTTRAATAPPTVSAPLVSTVPHAKAATAPALRAVTGPLEAAPPPAEPERPRHDRPASPPSQALPVPPAGVVRPDGSGAAVLPPDIAPPRAAPLAAMPRTEAPPQTLRPPPLPAGTAPPPARDALPPRDPPAPRIEIGTVEVRLPPVERPMRATPTAALRRPGGFVYPFGLRQG